VIETQARLLQMSGLDFACAIVPRAQFVHAFAIDIETDYRHTGLRKRDRNRKPDIAEADDSYLASVRQG
jgi:hypothetical protein